VGDEISHAAGELKRVDMDALKAAVVLSRMRLDGKYGSVH
jgi:hypothetical protein